MMIDDPLAMHLSSAPAISVASFQRLIEASS
jgi:hypothetical protein